MKKTLALCASVLLATQISAQELTHVRVETQEGQEIAALLLRQGFDVLEGSIDVGAFELVVSPAEKRWLDSHGYAPETIAVGRPFDDIQADRQALAGVDMVPTGYSNLAQILERTATFAAANPSICQYVDLTAKYGTPKTFEGRSLYGVKISDNVTQDEDEPTLLIVSCHHAREIVTPELALKMISNLTSIYQNPAHPDHQAVVAAVDGYEVWVLPMWNPDGYNEVFVGNNLWRKNRRVFAQGVGVDQNRNYPVGWSSGCAGSTNVNNETYKGPGPSSEPETLTMLALHADKRFAKVLDYHSYGRFVNYSYASCMQHPLAGFLLGEAQALATASTYNANAQLPPATGWQYQNAPARFGSLSFLIEVHTSFQPSFASALVEIDRVWPGALWTFERPISLSGHVSDAGTGLPLVADIDFGLGYTNGETNTSGGAFGRYQMFLPAGSYSATFSAAGYAAQSFPITIVDNTTAIVLDVALSNQGCPQPSVVVNNGVGFNPLCFTSLNPPELGTTWNVQVDASAFANVQWSAVWARVGNGGSFFFDPGEVLVGLQNPVAFNSFMAGSGVMVHSHAIANNPALAGQNWVVQGLCGREDRFVKFCNALDVTIGCGP
jgi:hypothetical protein